MAKRFLKIILFLVFLLNLNLNAIIIETSRLDDVFKYVDKNSIVVFDIDSTLVEIEHEFEYWINSRDEKLEEMGIDHENSCDLALYTFFVLSKVARLLPINNSPKVISKLQKMDIHSIALTNRSIPVVGRTIKLLKDINIDFSKNGLYNCNLDIQVTHNGIFSKGIIFAGKNDKGKSLALFFKNINYIPKKLIYIDDRIEYVKSVEKEFSRDNIDFIGIRYSFMDEKKKNFKPEEAEKQINKFKVQLGLEPLDPNVKGDKNIQIFQKKSVESPLKATKSGSTGINTSINTNINTDKVVANTSWTTYIFDMIVYPFKQVCSLFA